MTGAKLTIIVPTINSGDYIDIVLDYYVANQILVTIFVDSKTVDNTHEIAARYFPVRSMLNPASRIGEVVETISRACESDWVLRIDDDELPSQEMMRFVFDAVQRDDADVYGFPRHQCSVSATGQLLRHQDHGADHHRQWRLYRPLVVQYCTRGHSPGFELDQLRVGKAPSQACLVHLDWALHSYEARKEKIERYDRHKPNHGTDWTDFYLFEDVTTAAGRFEVLKLAEFEGVARRIVDSFPHRVVPAQPAERN